MFVENWLAAVTIALMCSVSLALNFGWMLEAKRLEKERNRNRQLQREKEMLATENARLKLKLQIQKVVKDMEESK